MSTPPRMMPRATGRAGEAAGPADAARATAMRPVESGSPREADERKRESGTSQDAELGPSAAALAEALFQATHALKFTGRLCLEEADPARRAITLPRRRVLMALAEAEACEGHAHRAEAEAEAGDERLRMGQHVRMGELAEALGVTARNVTTIVDGLEREGLIARRPDPTDRRAILLELTSKGHEHVAEVHALQREIAERFFAALSADDRRELLRLLAKARGGAGPRDGGAAEAGDAAGD